MKAWNTSGVDEISSREKTLHLGAENPLSGISFGSRTERIRATQ
jgi:hypothetical protein